MKNFNLLGFKIITVDTWNSIFSNDYKYGKMNTTNTANKIVIDSIMQISDIYNISIDPKSYTHTINPTNDKSYEYNKPFYVKLIFERNNVIYDIPYHYDPEITDSMFHPFISNSNSTTEPFIKDTNHLSNNDVIDNNFKFDSIIDIDGKELSLYCNNKNITFGMSKCYKHVFSDIFPIEMSFSDIVYYIYANNNNQRNDKFNEVDLHRNNMLTFVDNRSSHSDDGNVSSNIFRWLKSTLKSEDIDLFENMSETMGTTIYANIDAITASPICYSVSVIPNEKNLTYFTLGGNPYNEL